MSGLANGGYSWQVRAVKGSLTTDANVGTWWSFAVGPAKKTFLSMSLRNYANIVSAIVNGDFEGGSTGWTEYSSHGWSIIGTTLPSGLTAHSGSNAAWLGGDYSDTSYVQQQVSISAGAPYLVYWHWIASQDTCGHDFGKVLVNGTQLDSYALCSSANTGGWLQHSVNLSAYAGQSVTLQIRAETDDTLNSNLVVDDVSLQASAPASVRIDSFNLNLDAATTLGRYGVLLPGNQP